MSHAADAPAARLQAWLVSIWFRPRPTLAARLLQPLSWIYRLSAWAARAVGRRGGSGTLPSAVVVVGNLIVGGAGKTPTTIALARALQRHGRVIGIVSRGYGGRGDEVVEVGPESDPVVVGDEPLLISRRTGAPVFVGRDRQAAAAALVDRHPQVDLIVADDGLQHHRLQRDVEVVVFDARGVGNGLLLPAGPLRQPFTTRPAPRMMVLYNHLRASTPWPGACAQRLLSGVWPLREWLSGDLGEGLPVSTLRGRPLQAMAGLAVPERFFSALEDAGLTIERLPLPDHYDYLEHAWPNGTREVVTTEKDAVKLARFANGSLPIWVVGLDLLLPDGFVTDLLARLPRADRP